LKSRSASREEKWTAEIRILKKQRTGLLNKNKVFPHFSYDFLESKTPKLAYKQWKNTTYFVYNDKSTECPDCGYKKDVADKEGNLYWGQWSADGTKEGRGTMLFKYGDIYEGYWKDGKYEGKGRLIWHNGRKYLGRWRNGKM
jgi:hypothetical protein